jgi:hypothetical protein
LGLPRPADSLPVAAGRVAGSRPEGLREENGDGHASANFGRHRRGRWVEQATGRLATPHGDDGGTASGFAARPCASDTLRDVMGSVIKKRRRKIARHKYRKRLKRERFKRRRGG